MGNTTRAEAQFQAPWATGDWELLEFNWHLNRECDLIRNRPAVVVLTRGAGPTLMPAVPEGLAGALSDHYRLERALGAGGIATVYLAEDLKYGRKGAVKVLRPESGDDPRYQRLLATIGGRRECREGSDHLAGTPAVAGLSTKLSTK